MTRRYSEPRQTVVYDTECYKNHWAIGFESVKSGKKLIYQLNKRNDLDIEGIRRILRNYRIISFNGINYDMPMISLALSGATNAELKVASDMIIQQNLKPWEFRDIYGVDSPGYVDHVDLIEVAPGDGSLKLYGGRVHTERMQDLPFHHDDVLDWDQIDFLNNYMLNDLRNTKDLYLELTEQIQLRGELSDKYDIDLRSKSDAQIAEAVISSEVCKITGKRRLYKPDVRAMSFNYYPPDYVQFETENLQTLKELIENTRFVVRHDGKVTLPEQISKYEVMVGNMKYQVGIGGLHSTEKNSAHQADDDFILRDTDVRSYYPRRMINQNIGPLSMGHHFKPVFESIVERRLEAKAAGLKSEAETLKIVANGTFGKLGSPYSVLYEPKGMVAVTVGGQLDLLLVIERLHLEGFEVISANTDGFVTKIPRAREQDFKDVISLWQLDTGYEVEFADYDALYSRDVNSYIAVKPDGKAKRKGDYTIAGPGQPAAMGLKKNPYGDVSADAVVQYLIDGTPIENYIRSCRDIRKFVFVKRVNGGALYNGEVIGKAIRWYYSTEVKGVIRESKSGRAVGDSQGAKPCLQLPSDFPDDMDYARYVQESYAILEDIGLGRTDPRMQGRKGYLYGMLPDQKSVHVLDLSTGRALCGRGLKTLRKPWREFKRAPEEFRMCSKCRKEWEF